MKIKSKLILAATSMLVLSGVAAGTSTFAWYTANRQVDFAVTNINAQSSAVGLGVAYDPDTTLAARNTTGGADPMTTGSDPTEDDSTDIPFTFTNALTDVSGIGDGNFVKPMFGPTDDDSYSNIVGEWTDESTYQTDYANVSWYHAITLRFTATGTTATAKSAVYLDSSDVTTSIAEYNATTDTNTVINSVRIASVVGATQINYCNINGIEASYITDVSEGTATSNSVTTPTVLDNTFFGTTNVGGSAVYQGDGTKPADKVLFNDYSLGYLGTIVPTANDDYEAAVDEAAGRAGVETDENLWVTFYIWVEGEDSSTVADNSTNDQTLDFDLSLGFHTIDLSTIEVVD